MRVTADASDSSARGPMTIRRRSFFGRVLVLAAGAPFIPGVVRSLFGRPAGPSASKEEKPITVTINPLAVARTKKGSTRNA